LKFLSILRQHLKLKKKSYKGTMKSPLLESVKKGLYTPELELRLRKVLNIMHFIESYYTQFHAKLTSTIERLDAAAVSTYYLYLTNLERKSENFD
jgi:hypothetical protein